MTEHARERRFTWTDPLELARHLGAGDGLGWLMAMKDATIPPPPIVEALGMRLDDVSHGKIVFSMTAEEWMCNPAGVVHGGMVATLLDTVLTLCVVTRMPRGKLCQTVQLGVNYVRPLFATGERIVAEGVALHVGKTIATSEARAYNGHGKMLAHATTTLAILDGATRTAAPA